MTTQNFEATTILGLRHQGKTVLIGDGQVTLGNTIFKHTAKKIRRLFNDSIVSGFAGATADAFTLFERFEKKLEKHHGNLVRSASDLAKDWRTERSLRKLEAMMIVADKENMLVLGGNGDVVEPEHNLIAIGSGAPHAFAAGRALLQHSSLDAESIAREAMQIASEMCIYTNNHFTIETLG